MASEDITKSLKDIVTTLCDEFASESAAMLRLFQLKCWLFDERALDSSVLAEASRLYGSLAVVAILSNEMRPKRAQQPERASTAVEALVPDDQEFCGAIDRGFVRDKGFASLAVLETMSREQRSTAYAKNMRSLQAFTEFCLRASAANRRTVKEDAKRLYALAAARPDNDLRLEIDALLTARRQRLAFLFVANAKHPQLLEIEPSASLMWASLRKQSSNPKMFQTYFAQCAFVQGVIARGKKCTQAEIEKWSGRAAATKRSVPITAEELKEADDHEEKLISARKEKARKKLRLQGRIAAG